jgi:DNA-3-methyladenine glycosylase II
MSTNTRTYFGQLRAAEAHLMAASPIFAQIVSHIGPCTLTPNPDVFRVLVGSLISQFISTAAARAIKGRLEAQLKGKVTPRRLLNLTDEELRACGISGGKARAVRGVAEHFARNRRFAADLAAADDSTARALLLPLRGVGPWTVDMMLIFSLSRLDVWPVGDLGVRAGVRDLLGLTELPSPNELEKIAEPWRPYRSVAAWYVWRSKGFVPHSKLDDKIGEGRSTSVGAVSANGISRKVKTSGPMRR